MGQPARRPAAIAAALRRRTSEPATARAPTSTSISQTAAAGIAGQPDSALRSTLYGAAGATDPALDQIVTDAGAINDGESLYHCWRIPHARTVFEHGARIAERRRSPIDLDDDTAPNCRWSMAASERAGAKSTLTD
jgi:hypothetical protein